MEYSPEKSTRNKQRFRHLEKKMILHIFNGAEPEEDHISRYLIKSFPKQA